MPFLCLKKFNLAKVDFLKLIYKSNLKIKFFELRNIDFYTLYLLFIISLFLFWGLVLVIF